MSVFDLDLSSSMIDAIASHGERDYPIEACGIVLGRPSSGDLVRVVPMRNVQDRYHQRDPEAFPRDGRDAFRIDELERMRMLEHAEAEGLTERVLYHSHCDAGAYFSPEDRAMAVHQGIELMPGVVHVVVSIRNGKRADMAAFRYSASRRTFDETRVPLAAVDLATPDLELRAMEGREAARPIRPFGGMLCPRRITEEERRRLRPALDNARIRIDAEETLRDLRRFELGLLSPLTGFLRTVERRSIEQSGRLLSGTPWRTPVTLDIPAKKSAIFPPPGALVELSDGAGNAVGILGVSEVHRLSRDIVRLAGPVFVYESRGAWDAAETRAELLRRGARRVLAIVREHASLADTLDLSEFDAILSPAPISGPETGLELVLSGRDGWLDAVMAQNQGATHFWVEDPGLAREIEDTLLIQPWRASKPT